MSNFSRDSHEHAELWRQCPNLTCGMTGYCNHEDACTMKPNVSPAPERLHDLKCWVGFFQDVIDGRKTFEIRNDDRGYKVGDVLFLREWSPDDKVYTGRNCCRVVTYITSWGQSQGHVVMSISLPSEKQRNKVLCPYCNPLLNGAAGAAPQTDGGDVNFLNAAPQVPDVREAPVNARPITTTPAVAAPEPAGNCASCGHGNRLNGRIFHAGNCPIGYPVAPTPNTAKDREWGEGPEGDSDVMQYINQHHLLMSLLYDLNLLPEQHMDKPRDGKEWSYIFTITNHWRENNIAAKPQAAATS